MQPKPVEESYFNEVEISTIDGVSLGMSPVEVTLLKGQAENSSEKINKILSHNEGSDITFVDLYDEYYTTVTTIETTL